MTAATDNVSIPDRETPPPLLGALQSQLGLKLEPKKGDVRLASWSTRSKRLRPRTELTVTLQTATAVTRRRFALATRSALRARSGLTLMLDAVDIDNNTTGYNPMFGKSDQELTRCRALDVSVARKGGDNNKS